MKIGIVIIFFLVVLFYSASNSPNFKIEEMEYSALNASSTGIQEFLMENNTSPSEGQFNSSKNESSGSVAIALEKPPFID